MNNNGKLLTYFLDNFDIVDSHIKTLLKGALKFNLEESIYSIINHTNWNITYNKNQFIISLIENSYNIDNANDIAVTAWNTHESIRNTLKQDNIDVYNYFIKLETRKKLNEF